MPIIKARTITAWANTFGINGIRVDNIAKTITAVVINITLTIFLFVVSCFKRLSLISIIRTFVLYISLRLFNCLFILFISLSVLLIITCLSSRIVLFFWLILDLFFIFFL